MSLDLGDLAFYWRMKESGGEPNPVPTFLPFAFDYEPELELITQAPKEAVDRALRKTYQLDSNIGYMQEGHDLADRYGLDFLNFLENSLGTSSRRILDVGCGGCYILNALKKRGHEVFGLDPGPLAKRLGEKLDIPITTGFYPFEHNFPKMDVVLSSGVLEHVPDPVEFLRAHRQDLAEGGCIVVSTPDNEASIELGDPSMLLHEHISYFDENALHRTIQAAGYEIVSSGKAGYGQSLYAVATPSEQLLSPRNTDLWETFQTKITQSLERFREYVSPLEDVGFYVPLRALPYLSILKRFDGIRFFDDDSGTHGRMFDGFDVVVESWVEFQANPPSHVIVMSLPHAQAIKKKILERFPSGPTVVTLREILEFHPKT